MPKRSSTHSNKNPLDVKPLAEEKPTSQKKPYVFTRAFARLLGVDEEQAVAGYLATTSPGEPNPTIPVAASPFANAASDSSPGRAIPESGIENRKVTEILNLPNRKHPPVGEIQARVTSSLPAQDNRASSLSEAKATWESSPGWPISQTGGESRKVTEVPNLPNMKLPPVGEIQARVTRPVPVHGESNQSTSLPDAKATWESSPGRPTSQIGGESRKVTEIRHPKMKLPPVGEILGHVTKSQKEGDRSNSLPQAKIPWESNSERPINRTGVEIGKVAETPNPSDFKFPPVGEIQARVVTKSAPVKGESNRATNLPQAKAPSESIPQPNTQSGSEIREVTEISNPPNITLAPVGEIQARVVTKSAPVKGESNRATSLPRAKVPSETSPGLPIDQTGVETGKVAEISSNMKDSPAGEIRTQVTNSTAEGEGDRATSLPQAKAPSDSIPVRPNTQSGSEIGKVAEISNPPNTTLPPVGEIQARATKSVPVEGESNRASSLQQAKALLGSIPVQPNTQSGSEIRKVTGTSDPSIMKLLPVDEIRARLTRSASARGGSHQATSLSWETFSILLLVIALGFAVWGFYTRQSDNRVEYPVPPSSNPSASISPPVSVLSSKATKVPSFEVLIKAHKSVRVLIKADGRKVSDETLTGGAERSVRAGNQVIVKTGNLGALDFEFNGWKLPSQGAYGEAKTLEFGPSGLEVIISNPPTKIRPGE